MSDDVDLPKLWQAPDLSKMIQLPDWSKITAPVPPAFDLSVVEAAHARVIEALPSVLAVVNGRIKTLMDNEDVLYLLFADRTGSTSRAVPRWAIRGALIKAKGFDERQQVLTERFGEVLEDCQSALNGCVDPTWSDLTNFALEAVETAQAGHTSGAQALAAAVLDSTFSRYVSDGDDRRWITNRIHKGTKEKKYLGQDVLDKIDVLEALVWVPIRHSYEGAAAPEGSQADLVGFSRHATVHEVGPAQYTIANCAQALMIATSLLDYVQGREPGSWAFQSASTTAAEEG